LRRTGPAWDSPLRRANLSAIATWAKKLPHASETWSENELAARKLLDLDPTLTATEREFYEAIAGSVEERMVALLRRNDLLLSPERMDGWKRASAALPTQNNHNPPTWARPRCPGCKALFVTRTIVQFRSPDETWTWLCGQAGWRAFCEDCRIYLGGIITARS